MVGAEYSGINARVPALRIGRFAFTGATGCRVGSVIVGRRRAARR